jgi:apolipoprotein N-acyltransferase
MLAWDDSCRKLHIAIYCLITCFVYYGIGLFWLVYFDLRIYLLSLAAISPFLMLYFLPLRLLTGKLTAILKIFSAALWWVLLYKAYSLSPFSTIVIEVPFYAPLPFFQIAAVTGFILLPTLIMGLNASITLLIGRRSITATAGVLLFAAGLAAVFFWGNHSLKETFPTKNHWAIIQHNLPVSGRWRLEHPIYVRAKYRELALEAAKDKPGMIIFPLYSFPDDVLRNPEFFTGLAQETKTWILVATYIPQTAGQNITKGFFDAAILYSPDGKLVDHYQAVQPPPFRQIKEYNQEEYKVISSPFGKLGILLCYEDSVPAIAKKAVEKGADILIALSNPGHFSNTWMPHYHLMQDRLRAIETDRFVVRASANGYSGVVDPKGRFPQRTDLNKEEILQIQVG